MKTLVSLATIAALAAASTASAQVLFDNGTFSNGAAISDATLDSTTFPGETVLKADSFTDFGVRQIIGNGDILDGGTLKYEIYLDSATTTWDRVRLIVQLNNNTYGSGPTAFPQFTFTKDSGYILVDGVVPTAGSQNGIEFTYDTWHTVELDMAGAFASDLTQPITDPNINLLRIQLQGDRSGETYDGVYVRNVSVVPEPSTYAALLGAGVLGLALLRRRMRG